MLPLVVAVITVIYTLAWLVILGGFRGNRH
jgi:hypothetical protein